MSEREIDEIKEAVKALKDEKLLKIIECWEEMSECQKKEFLMYAKKFIFPRYPES